MKIVKDFVLREIGGEAVLVPTGETSQELNGMITMTDTAKFIWTHLEEAESLEALTGKLLETYEVDEETARRDTAGMIQAMLDHGMITFSREDHTW